MKACSLERNAGEFGDLPRYGRFLGFRDGMIPLTRCQQDSATSRPSHVPPEADTWPCSKGGSVGVIAGTARRRNYCCMLFYTVPLSQGLVSNREHDSRIDVLRHSIFICEAMYPRLTQPYQPVINLMTVARCIYLEFPGTWGRNRMIKPRGLAVFPSYRQPHDERSGYGLEAREGRIFLDCSPEVPIVNMQEPDPRLHICYAAVMSENYS